MFGICRAALNLEVDLHVDLRRPDMGSWCAYAEKVRNKSVGQDELRDVAVREDETDERSFSKCSCLTTMYGVRHR